MLELQIAEAESYDESTNRFVVTKAKVLKLEYSLKAVSLWESKWEVPFIDNNSLSDEQYLDFIRFMVVEGDFDPYELTTQHLGQIDAYIKKPCSATTITSRQKKTRKKTIMTSEVYYALMAQANVPYICDEWNINRLSKVLEVISSFTNGEEKVKESANQRLTRQAELNAKRRAEMKSKG